MSPEPFREVILSCECGGKLEPAAAVVESAGAAVGLRYVRCTVCKRLISGVRAKLLDPQKEFMIETYPVRLRSADEFQRAHDLLVPILLEQVTVEMTEAERRIMTANVDVLCWALHHDHNQTFANNLASAEQAVTEAGFQLAPR